MKYLVLLLVLIWFIGITEISYAEEFFESPNLIAVLEKENFLKSNFEYGDVISVKGHVMENHGLTKVGNAKIVFSLHWPNNTKIVFEEKSANESGDFSLLIPISSAFIAGKYHLLAEPNWLGYQPTLESKKKILDFFVNPARPDLILSPLQQIKSGIDPKYVVCKQQPIYYELVLKKSNNQPICVKGISVKALALRNYISEVNGASGGEIPVIDNTETESMIDLFESRYYSSKRTFVGSFVILNATNTWGETVSLVIQSSAGKVNATLTCNHMDWRHQEVITENILDYLQNKNCINPSLEEQS